MAAPARQATQSPPPPRRMTLAGIRTGARPAPRRTQVAGVEGVGKSTFAADAPNPIFIAAEDGIRHLNVASFPEPRTFGDVLDAVRTLIDEEHPYKTLAIDTVDWIEPLIWSDLCSRHGWESIETPGYGKGYAVALDEWRKLLAELDRLRAAKGMEIILLAHVTIKTFSNPAGQDFSRYESKLNRSASALVREWTDANLFATFEEFTKKDGMKVKGVSTGRRVLYTQRTAAWDAKNRFNLPDELPLSYEEYAAACQAAAPASADSLRAEAVRLLDELAPDAEKRATITTTIEQAGTNASTLAKIVDRLRSLVAEKE